MKEKNEPKKTKKKKDIRKVKSISPISVLVPYIMKQRNESCNLIEESVDVANLEEYIREKRAQGMKNLSMMHVLIAAYCRTVSQRPALNRFIRGQRVYTRRTMEVSLTIKKEMTLESPDTVIKIVLEPDMTLADVYEKLNAEIVGYRNDPGGDLDSTMSVFSHIPGVLLRGTIGFLRFLDYFRLLPKFFQRISPFHCSMYITSMGSLGIGAIYHHLYDFGTCPMFIAFGAKRRSYEMNPDGSVYKRQFMDVKFTIDERIVDGYYYASAFKLFRSIMHNPSQLDSPPENIVEDIR